MRTLVHGTFITLNSQMTQQSPLVLVESATLRTPKFPYGKLYQQNVRMLMIEKIHMLGKITLLQYTSLQINKEETDFQYCKDI